MTCSSRNGDDGAGGDDDDVCATKGIQDEGHGRCTDVESEMTKAHCRTQDFAKEWQRTEIGGMTMRTVGERDKEAWVAATGKGGSRTHGFDETIEQREWATGNPRCVLPLWGVKEDIEGMVEDRRDDMVQLTRRAQKSMPLSLSQHTRDGVEGIRGERRGVIHPAKLRSHLPLRVRTERTRKGATYLCLCLALSVAGVVLGGFRTPWCTQIYPFEATPTNR